MAGGSPEGDIYGACGSSNNEHKFAAVQGCGG